MDAEIRYLAINELYPHPENPRKDVGDVTELAESIRANGVMQNLTVVPGHRLTDAEWTEMHDRYEKEPDETLRERLNKGRSPAGYTVVIGHRRLAAARIAGLTAVPCVVTDMDHKTQIATMLLENMQRADLTIPEQAAGMQMMIDLGATVAEICAKTGYGESTVRRRLQVASLDRRLLDQSWEAGGCTLEEYCRIATIRSVKERENVLKAVGTNNFAWKLNAAIREQEEAAGLRSLKPLLKAAGIPKYSGSEVSPQWNNGRWSRLAELHTREFADGKKEPELPKDLKDVCWHEYGGVVYLLRPAKKAAQKKKSAKEQQADERRAALKKLNALAQESRRNFIHHFSSYKKYEGVLREELLRAVIRRHNCGVSYKALWMIVEEPPQTYTAPADEALETALRETPAKLAILIYGMYDDDKVNCTGYSEGTTLPPYRKNARLEDVYRFLERLGYETSDEERQMLDGTHPLYGEEGRT